MSAHINSNSYKSQFTIKEIVVLETRTSKDYFGISLRSTVKLQFSGLGWSAAKGPLFWSCPLFLDLFMYYFLKMVTEKSPVKWSYPLFLVSDKLEFHCTIS